MCFRNSHGPSWVLHQNFVKWVEAQGRSSGFKTDMKKEFSTYMEEEFQIREGEGSILDLLSTMIAPSSESSTSSAVMKNQMACSSNYKRKKRSTGEEYFEAILFQQQKKEFYQTKCPYIYKSLVNPKYGDDNVITFQCFICDSQLGRVAQVYNLQDVPVFTPTRISQIPVFLPKFSP